MENKTFAKQSIKKMVVRKNQCEKFQDNDERYNETYTEEDKAYSEIYTVHDEQGETPTYTEDGKYPD